VLARFGNIFSDYHLDYSFVIISKNFVSLYPVITQDTHQLLTAVIAARRKGFRMTFMSSESGAAQARHRYGAF
jgi:hypothetical protein